MAYDPELAARVRECLAGRPGLEEKKMFGGVGFLLGGNLCCGVLRGDLILRLGPEAAEATLEEPHVRPFDITGRAMKGWAMVDRAGWEEEGDLRRRVAAAAAFAASLPPK